MGCNHGFKGHLGPKPHRLSIIHHHKNGPLPFFAKHFEVGFIGPRHDPPIHETHIISRLIPPGFLKIDAPAFKRGPFAAGQ
jgi:hypothetical protein